MPVLSLGDWMTAINDVILRHAGEPWTYAVTTLLCWVDGFFPPLPAESIVIAMSALHSTGRISLPLLVVLAIIGAWCGDNTAYWIGRLCRLDRLFRGERGAKMLAKADALLQKKAAVILLTARFIPVYRVAINMTAGTLRFPVRRFMLLDLASATIWALQAVVIGLGAGALFHDSPLLGIVVGILLGLVVGIAVDRAHSWFSSRRG